MKKTSSFKKFLIFSLLLHFVLFIVSVTSIAFLPSETITIEPTMRVDVIALPDKIEKIPKAEKAQEKAQEKKLKKKPKEKPAPKKVEKISKKPKKDSPKKPKETEKKAEKPTEETSEKPTAEAAPVIKGNVLSKGTQLEGLVKLDFDDYFDAIRSAANSNWELPEWLSEEGLRSVVAIKVNEDGTIASKTIKESSGNDVFDNSVLKTFDTIGRLPEPPERIKSLINAYPILLGFPE